MTKKIKHIFIFIFLLSICSLTVQASVISFCKESKVFKNQNNPVTEEEEESHDSDEDANEFLFITNNQYSINSILVNKAFWSKSENDYLSFTKSIPIPPPKF
jgi:hypothetical protein